MQGMAKKIPNSELRVLPGVGHSGNLEDPDQFVEHFTGYFS